MDYFGRKARANKRAADKLGACATFFFRLGFFVLTPAMLIIHGLKLGGEQLDPWMQVVTPAAFVIAGACDYYAERMLFSEHAKQYSRMHDIFRKSLNLFEKAGDNSLRQSVILAAGKEALAENGDWVLMHRERPIEVPQG